MVDTVRDAGQTGPLLVRQTLVTASKGMVVGDNPVPLPRPRGPSCEAREDDHRGLDPEQNRHAGQNSAQDAHQSVPYAHYFVPDTAKLRSVRLFSNTRIYERIGGLYDASLGFWSREVRRQGARALDLREDERLLIVGVGTGMELEHLPAWVRGVGVDLSAGMLERAHRRRAELGMRGMELRVMDARTLDFPDESFDAVYLPLVLTVVEDGARVFAEAARVAAPGGRLVVADRFWPEGRSCPPVIRRKGVPQGQHSGPPRTARPFLLASVPCNRTSRD